MKRFNIIILVMILVSVLATWLLNKEYSEIPLQVRALIILGGATLSSVLSYIMIRIDTNNVDTK
ncbi:hypothetical protein [Peribacillus acanthi]|uniref:hypothetical protein n=1 Tax=Peribacillus acanthi TaxID=2171554 RepID=UPI000D3EA3BD|nr:hypothetical protein [Peribacillus acanthi]